ncbi:uncharacterized protein LOC119677655 [Teleopsis dalmanni]|uniref:uncharacterized protein LOC119677655 n=1 Tax=Teleopsis dalmanni TaxID=139649 RepID=UPI0018CED64F|nr:uncharacterized protein LOC119677655 [Teleopsis dalmanni]
MWDQLERYKNHFIQHDDLNITAGTINELVHNEFTTIRRKRELVSTKKKPWCEYPKTDCRNSNYFDDRTQLAYGWFALPKLLVEMNHDDLKIRWQATNSFSEFVLNPINAETAIHEMDIMRRLQNALHRVRRSDHEYAKRIETKILVSLEVLTRYIAGAGFLVRRPMLLNEIYNILLNEEPNFNLVASIVRNITEKAVVLLYVLAETDVFDKVTKIFLNDRCKNWYPSALWMHLSHFLEIIPEKALENGFFDLLYERVLAQHAHFHRQDVKCFALLLRCGEGQRLFDEHDGIKMVYNLIKYEKLPHSEYSVLCLMNGLLSKRAMWRVREFTDLPSILTERAKDTCNERLQLYCLRIIRLLGDMPCMKRYIRLNCEKSIKDMICLNKTNECLRDNMLKWLNTEIYN